VTLTLKDGTRIEGYIFDRRSDGPTLADCAVRLFPRSGEPKRSIRYSDIARLEFTGRDTAAGNSYAAWLRSREAAKAAGSARGA